MARIACPPALGLIAFLFLGMGAEAAPPRLPRQLCGAKQEVAEVVTPRANAHRTAYLGDWVTIYICHQDALALGRRRSRKTSPSS